VYPTNPGYPPKSAEKRAQSMMDRQIDSPIPTPLDFVV
jgi:hypothetical protein